MHKWCALAQMADSIAIVQILIFDAMLQIQSWLPLLPHSDPLSDVHVLSRKA